MKKTALCYLLAISLLGLYALRLHRQKQRREGNYVSLLATLHQTEKALLQQVESLSRMIDRHVSDYPCAHNHALGAKAAFIQTQLDSITRRGLAKEQLSQQTLMCAALALEKTAAACQVLEGLHKQLIDDELNLDAFLPVLSSGKQCLRAGESFKGGVYGYAYPSADSFLTFYVDKQRLPKRAGLGQWTKIYRTPGNKTISCRVESKSPLTGEIKSYQKEFRITICE